MLLQYHDDILNRSINKDYFNNLEKFKYVNFKLLINGLHYPDVPCSDLIYTNNNQVKFLNYNTCKMPISLIYLFNEHNNGLKEVVQSHRGRQAIGHSMTYEPNVSMIEIRQKILRRLEILYMLALNDNSLINKCSNNQCEVCYNFKSNSFTCIKPEPNIFWLGQIIHCIQDSYSRVHTLRMLPKTNIILNSLNNNISKNKEISDKENSIPSFKLIKIIGDLIDNLTLNNIILENGNNNDIQTFLKKYITDKIYIKIIDDNPKDISHIFKLILFFKIQQKNIIELFMQKNNLPSYQNLNNNKSTMENYPYIISFRYIPHQQNCNKLFHMTYDTKEKTIEAGFEQYMIENCIYVLELYKKHLLDTTTNIKDKIYEMITYISQNVFPILDEYKNQPSANICNPHPCECELDLDKVYDIYKHQSGGYYKKYIKYKIKYIELKNSTS